MNRPRLERSVKLHEGYRSAPYRDTLDFWTVGYGTLIDRLRLTELPDEIETVGDLLTWLHDDRHHHDWLQRDLDAAIGAAQRFAGRLWPTLTTDQQEVLAEMAYQLGSDGLWKFARMRRALRSADFEQVRAEMLASRWARQTPTRARTLADRMYRPPGILSA